MSAIAVIYLLWANQAFSYLKSILDEDLFDDADSSDDESGLHIDEAGAGVNGSAETASNLLDLAGEVDESTQILIIRTLRAFRSRNQSMREMGDRPPLNTV